MNSSEENFERSMIDVVDFFCGCGGTSAGLRAAGMNILAGIDSDKDAAATFKRNFPDARTFLEDIRNLHPFDLDQLIPRLRERPLLFSSCAPCQPFTKQKTTKRRKDSRTALLDEFHRFVRTFRPEYVFVENVPGLQKISASRGPLGRFVTLLKKLGYSFEHTILKSQNFGVPQCRERFVLVASLIGPILLPNPTNGPGSGHDAYISVGEAIGDLPPIEAGETHAKIANHRSAGLSELNLERIRAAPVGGGRNDWPEHLKLQCHEGHSGHTDVYGRLHLDRPASALTTRCISLSNGRYGHPTQDRAISVREAARLQTFPDDFIFEGSLASMAQQIGNAVPVKLIELFGRQFLTHYRTSIFGEHLF